MENTLQLGPPGRYLYVDLEPMLGNGPDRDAKIQAFVADTPLKRFGMPDEVAAIAVMLASDEATYVTDTEVSIDGGYWSGLLLTRLTTATGGLSHARPSSR